MFPDLTPEQLRAFQSGSPIRLHDPALHDVVVCPAAIFEQMEAQLRALAEDEKEQEAWGKLSMRTLAERIREEEHD